MRRARKMRLAAMLEHLRAHPEGATAADLAQAFEVSSVQARADMEKLRAEFLVRFTYDRPKDGREWFGTMRYFATTEGQP